MQFTAEKRTSSYKLTKDRPITAIVQHELCILYLFPPIHHHPMLNALHPAGDIQNYTTLTQKQRERSAASGVAENVEVGSESRRKITSIKRKFATFP